MAKPCFFIDGKLYTREEFLEWAKNVDFATVGKILPEFQHAQTPFQKTDQWLNLAMRRMIRYAAENGYDAIAWTNGEQQAERYDLSKSVDSIAYKKNDDGTYELMAVKGDNRVLDEHNVSENKLEDYIGKDIAQKITNGEGEEASVMKGRDIVKFNELSGDGLKVGGSGMKAFYDSIVPNAANKLGKAFGAKVETIDIPLSKPIYNLTVKNKLGNISNHDFDSLDMKNKMKEAYLNNGAEIISDEVRYNNITQQSIPITPSMRQSAMEGMPLFSIIGSQGAKGIEGLTDNLNIAKQMEAAGKDARTIFRATGWEKFHDGWKYDLPDNITEKLSISDIQNLPKGDGNYTVAIPLSDYMDAPELFSAYPELKELNVKFYNYGSPNTPPASAVINVETKTIEVGINDKSKIKSLPDNSMYRVFSGVHTGSVPFGATDIDSIRPVIVHEVQHYIQEIAGFGQGGNADALWESEVEKRLKEFKEKDWWQAASLEHQKKIAGEQIAKELGVSTIQEAKFGIYNRLAGEVEARNAERRLNTPVEQRKQQMLSETQDVAEDQKIYLQGAIGEAYSQSDSITPQQAQKLITDHINAIDSEKSLDEKHNAIQGFVDSMNTAGFKTQVAVLKTRIEAIEHYKTFGDNEENNKEVARQMNIGSHGFFSPLSDSVFICSENIYSAKELIGVWLHELTHHGTKVSGVDTYDLFNSINEDFIRDVVPGVYWQNFKGTPKQKRDLANEFVSHVAQNIVHNPFIFNKFVAGEDISGLLADFYGQLGASPQNAQRLEEITLKSLNNIPHEHRQNISGRNNNQIGNAFPSYSNRTGVQEVRGIGETGQGYDGRTGNSEDEGQTVDTPANTGGLETGFQQVQRRKTARQNIAEKFNGEVQPAYSVPAYHGSPNSFEKFSTEFMGNTIDVDGKPRSRTNSKGQPIADTDEKIRNFYRWFGDSVVTYSDKPLVVFHGTNADFDTFEKGESRTGHPSSILGFYFAKAPYAAELFTKVKSDKPFANVRNEPFDTKASVLPVYLSLQNPKVLTAREFQDLMVMPDYSRVRNLDDYSEIKKQIESEGYDGIIIKGDYFNNIDNEYVYDQYVIFNSNQAKSATGNNGDFDPDKGSILFSKPPDLFATSARQNINAKFNGIPPTVPPATPKGGNRNTGNHGQYVEKIKYIATDKDMKHNFLHNPVQFAKDFPKYIHELVRKPLLSIELMENDLKTDDLSRPSQALVKVNAQANGYIHEFEKKVFPKIVDAYADIYKANKLDQDAVGEYLYAKASLERTDKQFKPAFSEDPKDEWNRDYVEKTIKDFESTVDKKLVDNLWAAIKTATDYKVDTWLRTGRIDEEQAAEYKKRDFYVPLKGWEENPDDFYDYKTKSFGGNGMTIHKAEQRTSRPEGNPIEQIVFDVQNAIKAGQKNLALQHFIRLAQNNPDKKNIINIQETWIVKDGTMWVETNIRPDQSYFDKTAAAQKRITGLSLSRFLTARRLMEAQKKGASMIQLSRIQDQLDVLDQAIADASEDIVIRRVFDNSNYDQRTQAQAKEHEIRAYMGGRSYLMHTNDPNVAAAARGDNLITTLKAYGKFGQGVANLTRAWQQNVTGKAINFFIPNAIRDIQAAAQRHAIMPRGNAKLFIQHYPTAQGMVHRYITGKANPVYNELGDPKSPKYNPEAMTKEQQQNYWDWFMDTMVKAGARSGYIHMGDLAKTRKQVRKEIKAATEGRNPIEAIKYYAWHNPGRLLEWGGIMSEDPTRIATAIATHLQGYSDELASTDSKEITVNFDRGSRIKGVMSPVFAFFQARVEGTANHFSQWKHNPKGMAKAMAMWMAAGALITEALRALMDDDEKKQFEELPSYVKYGYYVIPKSFFGMESGLIRIPLPHGFSAYFAAGRVIDDVARGYLSPQDGANDVLASSFNAFTPVSLDGNDITRAFVPALMVPGYDYLKNKDFAGRTVYKPYPTEKEKAFTPNTNMGLRDVSKPILDFTRFMNNLAGGDWEKGISPQYKMDDQGRFVKKTGVPLMFANLLDWNPSVLEHAFVYWAGGRGELYTQSAKLVSAIAGGDEIRPNYIPVLSRFTLSKGSGDVQADYYKVKPDLDLQVKQRSIARKNDNTEAVQLQNEDRDMRNLLLKYKMTEARIKLYNKVINNEDMPAERIEDYKERRKQAIADFMEYYNTKTK